MHPMIAQRRREVAYAHADAMPYGTPAEERKRVLAHQDIAATLMAELRGQLMLYLPGASSSLMNVPLPLILAIQATTTALETCDRQLKEIETC